MRFNSLTSCKKAGSGALITEPPESRRMWVEEEREVEVIQIFGLHEGSNDSKTQLDNKNLRWMWK